MSREFYESLANHLRTKHGRIDVSIQPTFYGDVYAVAVAGCDFRGRYVRGNKSLEFLGIRVKVSGRNVNIGALVPECALKLLAELPRRQEIREEELARNKRSMEAYDVTRCLEGTPFRVTGYSDKFTMIFEHENRLTVMAAIDYLQDAGFVGESPPEHAPEKFHNSRILAIWYTMSEDDRAAFLASVGVDAVGAGAGRPSER